MSNNVTLNPGSGGVTISTEDNGSGVQLPRTKLMLGAAGSDGGDVTGTNPLPIQDAVGTTAAIAAGSTTAAQVIKASAGSLLRVVVTGSASAALSIYDNASAASGTVIGVIKSTAVAGDVYVFNMPAAAGITAGKVNGSPACTVSYI